MLKLEVVDYKGLPLSRPVAVVFDKVGGTIGRGDSNALVLPDADRIISRMHARISFRSGRYFIEDHGSSTPVIVNGHALGRGVDAPLTHGDDMQIGGYRLRVDQQTGRAAVSLAASQTIVVTPGVMPLADAALDETRDILLETRRFTREELGPTDPSMAFLDGAGVDGSALPGGLTPQTMQGLGRILRQTVQALLDLQAWRATLDGELRAGAAANDAHETNPLKFSATVDAALAHLFAPQRDDMPPLEAVQNVSDELRAHQSALVAGMRAALAAVLQRVDPEQIEYQLRSKSVMDSLLPANRKARLWDQFDEIYAAMTRDSQAAFPASVEREFARAYEAQLRKLAPSGLDSTKR